MKILSSINDYYKHSKNIYTTVTVFAWVAVLKPLQVRRFPFGGDIFIKIIISKIK